MQFPVFVSSLKPVLVSLTGSIPVLTCACIAYVRQTRQWAHQADKAKRKSDRKMETNGEEKNKLTIYVQSDCIGRACATQCPIVPTKI